MNRLKKEVQWCMAQGNPQLELAGKGIYSSKPDVSVTAKFRLASRVIMVSELPKAKEHLSRLLAAKARAEAGKIREPFVHAYMARARRVTGYQPVSVVLAIEILIDEQLSFCRGLIRNARQMRVAGESWVNPTIG